MELHGLPAGGQQGLFHLGQVGLGDQNVHIGKEPTLSGRQTGGHIRRPLEQYDFLGKLKFYMTGSLFVDKAHSMYLQTALTTGVLSLAAILVLFVMYAVLSLKVLWDEDFTEFLPAAGLACFAAFCGYAIAGLFNDSTITVAPVFWVLLGMGTGINVMLGKKRTGEVAGK